MAANSPRNQPDTILTATRPLLRWLMVAICLAATAGVHGPGRMAAMTFSFSVALKQRMAERDRLVLKFGAVAGGKSDLAQRIIEA